MRALSGLAVFLILLGRGTRSDAADDSVDIYIAAYEGNLKQVKSLLAAEPKLLDRPATERPSKRSPNELFTPLQAAVAGGRLNVAKWLLEQGANANVPNESKTTALHLAVATWRDNEAAAFVKLLLAHKAKVDARDYAGRTALHGAAGHHLRKAALLLLAHGAAAGARDRAGLMPLHEAAWAGDEDMVRLLRKHGATVDTPLACYFGDVKRVRAFLGAEPALASAADAAGRTLLHYAVAGGHRAMVVLLLDHRANPDARTRGSAITPLDWAVRRGRRDLAALLLERGASIHVTDKYGWTPLHRAVTPHRSDVVWFDFPGRLPGVIVPASPLAGKDRLPLVKLLLENHANVDAQTREYQGTGLGIWPGGPNDTPLHLAAAAGLVEVAALLVDHGATVDIRNRDGQTAMYAAVKAGHKEMVRFLLKHRANVNAVDEDGRTPLAWSLKWKQDEIAQLLRAHGGQAKAPRRP